MYKTYQCWRRNQFKFKFWHSAHIMVYCLLLPGDGHELGRWWGYSCLCCIRHVMFDSFCLQSCVLARWIADIVSLATISHTGTKSNSSNLKLVRFSPGDVPSLLLNLGTFSMAPPLFLRIVSDLSGGTLFLMYRPFAGLLLLGLSSSSTTK